jgi:precorrin-6B methylase 2
VRLREVRRGPGKGVRLLLNRQADLQREFGLWEHELAGLYRRHIASQSVVYDIGAADGMTALMFAALAPSGHVYAFEPDHQAARAFERNLDANPELVDRVTLVRSRVGADATRLDEFAERQRAPDFVKIDVDGGELNVLETMSHLLAERQLAIVVETHSVELEEECARFLRRHGQCVRVVKNAWWRKLYPELRPIEHNRWLFSRTISARGGTLHPPARKGNGILFYVMEPRSATGTLF